MNAFRETVHAHLAVGMTDIPRILLTQLQQLRIRDEVWIGKWVDAQVYLWNCGKSLSFFKSHLKVTRENAHA